MKKDLLYWVKSWTWAFALIVTLQPCLSPASELIATDDAGGGLPAGIASLDFYDNGLFWTVYGGGCSGEFSSHPSLAVLGFRSPPFPFERYVTLGCPPNAIGGAARDDAFAFYTTPGGVQRKSLSAAPADSSSLIGLFWNNLTPGAMMTFNNRAYYAYNSPGGQISDSGYFRIEYFELPGNGGNFEPVIDVSNGAGLPNVGRITKMAVVWRRVIDGEPIAPFGVALTDGGYLLRFFVDQTIPAFRTASIIATDVTDFAVRREQFIDSSPFGLFFEQDQLYASIGRSRCPTSPLGRVVTIDPINGGIVTTVFTAPDGYISAIAADSEYLFASTYGRRQLGGPFGGCDLDGTGVIRSKCSPSRIFGACSSGIDPNWNAIEIVAGENMRSDGRQLYFTRNKQVRRMPNNSPPLRHDFAALRLEAVQVVQDLNNSVRLVEGKRTIVRAYARVADSTIPQPDWFPNAQLRGFRDGVELPGPLYPIGSTRINTDGNLANLRPDATRSFQFELPAEWVRMGLLTLRFTVNATLATYESGGNPLANNTVEAVDLRVVQVQPPCFVFSTIHHAGPNYWPWENPNEFARIMERAKALLPVPDIHVHTTTERVSDEHICLRTCDGPFGIPFPCGFVCNDPFDLSQKDDWDEALEELECYDSFDQNRPGCGRTHYVGAIHPANTNVAWAGLARTPGNHMLVRMNPADGVSFNSTLGGRTMAHEFAHNLGRQHVNQNKDGGGCGGNTPDRPDMTYPFNGCTFGTNNLTLGNSVMGWDMVKFAPVAPTAAGDLLSYAGARWPSAWSYNAMLAALSPNGPAFSPAAAPAGPYLLVRGILKLTLGTARLKPCYSLDQGVADPAKIQRSLGESALQPAHGYFIRKLNGAGAVLEETSLVIKEIDDADEVTSTINQFITKPAGMAAVQIVKDGVVIAENQASASAPVVHQVAAVYDPLGPSLQVTINATDADGDVLRFAVQFSNDNGATWRTLRVNEGSYSFIANPRFLAGGAQCRLRVVASDGFHSGAGLSGPFVLPGRAPEPFIGGIVNGQRLPFGTTESLLGFALDAEDGSLPVANLNWNIVGPTPRTGTGGSLSLQGLAPGVYTATLDVTDADNNPGTATITFEILPLVVVDRGAPVVDGEANDAAYAGLPAVQLPLSPRTTARFLHAAGHLYAAFTDLPYGGFFNPGRMGLYIDANNSGGTTPQAGDVAFYVNEDGTPEQFEGNGSQMVLKANPSPGFKAVITRGVSGWNAEFRIADNLIGGWEHAARIGIVDQYAITRIIGGFPVDFPAFVWWPDNMNSDQPDTWAPAWFGYLPSPGNQAPVALVEAPRYVDMNGPTTVSLNGGASYDPEGTPLAYTWTQLNGPSVSLQNSDTATPSFTYSGSSATTFRFRLVVSDGFLESAPDEVELVFTPVAAQPVPLPPAATRNQDGSVTVGLQWPGRPGDPVIIQASTDLETWEDLTLSSVNSLQSVLFSDAEAGLYSQRFYRLADGPSGEVPSAAATALQFDGLDDMVTVPHAAALDSFPLTIAFWMKTSENSLTVRGLVSKYTDNSFNGYALMLAEGRVRGWYFRNNFNYIWDGGWGLDSGPVADGQWHHIALVVDAAGARLYVDGTRKSSLGWTGTSGATTSVEPLQFGRYANYPVAHNGQLDEIAMWNRALTEAEVNQLVPGKLTGFETGLLGYWSLDEGTGETANDSSTSAFPGDLVNGPLWVQSTAPLDANPVAGNALRFDGVDDSVEVGSAAALNVYPLTVTAWIKTKQHSPGYVSVANKYAAGSGNGYSFHINNGRLAAFYFRGNGTSFVYAGDPGLDGGFIADGQWHHVAYVVDSGGGRIYVDGVMTGSLGWTGTPGPCTTATPLRFGLYPLGGQTLSFDGRMDEITLWNRGLNASEVNSVGRFSVTGVEADLVSFWPFDDGAGTTATDATGNGRNGTLLNGPVWVGSEVPILP